MSGTAPGLVWWLEAYRENLAGSHADPGRAEALAKAWDHMTPQDKDGWRDMIFERLRRSKWHQHLQLH